MSPSEDATLLLQLVARHLTALRLNLAEAYPDEEWGFTAQQALEKLLKALIVLADERPPFTHELRDLADRAGVALSPDLLALQAYAVEARYSPRAFPLPAPRADLLKSIETLDRRVILCRDEQARREAGEAS
jgi:HEPN domain-containing protein